MYYDDSIKLDFKIPKNLKIYIDKCDDYYRKNDDYYYTFFLEFLDNLSKSEYDAGNISKEQYILIRKKYGLYY